MPFGGFLAVQDLDLGLIQDEARREVAHKLFVRAWKIWGPRKGAKLRLPWASMRGRQAGLRGAGDGVALA